MTNPRMAPPVSDEFLAEIGRVTACFALLEEVLSMLIWSTIPIDMSIDALRAQAFGQIITAELAYKNKVALVSSLYLHMYGKGSKKAVEADLLAKRAADLEVKRNQITHSIWAEGNSSTTYARMKTTAKQKDGLRWQRQQMTIRDLKQISDEIQLLCNDISAFTYGNIDETA